ncbi:FIG00731835: hypothetical protein [Klebsiella pneumoniae IS53]|nr:FIG00731835: hypothetical protein [Klebsiella pneumoniae IS53]
MNNVMNFPAQLSSLSTLAAWLAQQMAPLPVGEEWRFALDLAVCETATNIIRYALHEDRQRVFSCRIYRNGRPGDAALY